MQSSNKKTSGHTLWVKKTSQYRRILLAILVSVGGVALGGCRITEDDVHLWARKSMGPTKLVAVLQHEKYEKALRVEAAFTLVTMKPRNGRLVGLIGSDDFDGLFVALSEMGAKERTPIVDALVPQLVSNMTAAKEDKAPDTSYGFKDAAFGLFKYEGENLISSTQSKQLIREALIHWSNHRFESRLDNTSQIYGMGQILEYLNADGVRGLAPQITAESKKLAELSAFIKKLGDEKTKDEASARLVTVAQFVDSTDWVKQKSPAVKAANEKNPAYKTISTEQFTTQMQNYQRDELFRVFAAMKNLGMKPAVDYLLKIATNPKESIQRRQNALAALEGNLNQKDSAHAKAMLTLLADDNTPDEVRGLAIARIGELSRDQVASSLFKLFKNDRWQVRASAAALLLRMSSADQIDEFMKNLGKVRHLAINETFSYGGLLGKLKDAEPKKIVEKFSAKGNPASVRLSALGYYYVNGDKSDLPAVQTLIDDRQRAPTCSKNDQNCDWVCQSAEKGKLVNHDIKTVGSYAKYCIIPHLSNRLSPEEAQALALVKAEPSSKTEAAPSE